MSKKRLAAGEKFWKDSAIWSGYSHYYCTNQGPLNTGVDCILGREII